jgi:hypothetical protein
MHNAALSDASRHRIVEDQVGRMFARSHAWKGLAPSQRAEIIANTTEIVKAMAEGAPSSRPADPYWFPHASALDVTTPPSVTPPPASTSPPASTPASPVPFDPGPPIQQGTQQGPTQQQPQSTSDFKAEGIAAGVGQIARIVKEVGFPNFVASLIQGTFHAIVTSSIEQMKAYGELVKSVAQSLTDFRDSNVTENQGKDNLVSRYPNIFKLTIVDGAPRVRPRDGVDTMGDLPDFRKDLGLPDDVTDLDDETIDNKLVPAARDDLARSRQQLLATMVLMGINRIIVTDGKINAKVQFQFSAKDQAQTKAVHYDYWNFGQITASGSSAQGTDQGALPDPEQPGSPYANSSQSMSMPDVKVTSQSNTDSTAALQASGALFGEVNINFRSESFPLERMADTNQIIKLQQAQAGGRGAPPPATTSAAAPTTTTAAPPTTTAPAPAPAAAPRA